MDQRYKEYLKKQGKVDSVRMWDVCRLGSGVRACADAGVFAWLWVRVRSLCVPVSHGYCLPEHRITEGFGWERTLKLTSGSPQSTRALDRNTLP